MLVYRIFGILEWETRSYEFPTLFILDKKRGYNEYIKFVKPLKESSISGFAYAGENAYKANKIVSVDELIKSLVGEYENRFAVTIIKQLY